MDQIACIAAHPEFVDYDFGPDHPLRPERILAGLGLLQALGVWDPDSEALIPAPAPREELELVHQPGYIRAIETAGSDWFPRGELARYGLSSAGDTRPFPNMHHVSALLTAGSTEAARLIMRGEIAHAFNPAGGLHHAMPARASGFCVYNDPAVAAAVAVREFGARVLYVDFDCHHGDGVQEAFYDRADVMTISFHESGRYLFPGTGFVEELGEGPGLGYSLNVPVQPFTTDDSWLRSIHRILPEAVERFRPDLIISSHGADTHHWDPLTHVSLTTQAFAAQARLTHELAHAFAGGRWLAVGSGGYDWRRVVPRSWAIVWAEMAERALPDGLPGAWVAQWSPGADAPFPRTIHDDSAPLIPDSQRIERANDATVDSLLAALTARSRP